MKTHTRQLGIMVAIAALAGVVWVVSTREPPNATTPSPSASEALSAAVDAATTASANTGQDEDAAGSLLGARRQDGEPNVVLAARWGSAPGELGRSRPQEGNPEGPMSLARAGDDLLVLDQVNRRVTRYDGKGRVRGTFETTGTVQDIAVAKDGTVAVLDRLVDKTVSLVDKNGRSIGALPIPTDRIPSPGLVTGLFVDGKDVYLEKEHGVLTRIGTTDGKPADAAELSGRPSKDGVLLLLATLATGEGLVTLNAFDRKLDSLRFTRAVPFPRPIRQVVLVDSDARGTIYVGVTGGTPSMVHVACLDPGDGHALGRVTIPTSGTEEESFRDFTVAEDGTIVVALRADEGIEYRTAHCP